jgi:hypothetical protein
LILSEILNKPKFQSYWKWLFRMLKKQYQFVKIA